MTTTRQRYVVGDIQGCHDEFAALLASMPFDSATDSLWIAGDMINRGPDNVSVLRRLRALGDGAVCVLGNHDFFFLSVVAGATQLAPGDTLGDLLAAPDCADLVDWVRRRPLLHVEDGFAMVHAGLLPQWSVAQARALAAEVEQALRADDWQEFIRGLWGGKPVRWQDDLQGPDRLRIIVNAMCRMRFLQPDGSLDLKPKGKPEANPERIPWYAYPDAAWRSHTLVHGHWSALGFRDTPGVISLDTGCVWGGALTAIRLADRHVWQVRAMHPASPGDE
ncbi:MAG: symmetrical bis(5'-nucleosyl)-tetraphosphatase [Candidatus Dactylopiibacterium sp.]|nr:symmetrical bis(5'-nucleosyl)-tetraphosphatase [Candidatus Dactylopiibacterium sp.]